MKANYKNAIGSRYGKLSHKEREIIQQEVDKEFENKHKELYLKVQKNIAVQYTAAVMVTLEQWYDFDKDDMLEFMNHVGSTFEDMDGIGFVGKYDCLDLKEHIMEKYGINLDDEISVELKR